MAFFPEFTLCGADSAFTLLEDELTEARLQLLKGFVHLCFVCPCPVVVVTLSMGPGAWVCFTGLLTPSNILAPCLTPQHHQSVLGTCVCVC